MNKKNLFLRIISAVILLIVAGGAFAYWYAAGSYSGNPVRVEIPAGASRSDVGAILRAKLGSGFGNRVANLWEFQGGAAERSEGSYLVEPGTSAIRIARTIYNGRQTPIHLTFNNLRTVEALASRVGSVMELDSADFMAACDSILPTEGFKKAEYASAFIPDTYEFYWIDSANKVVNKLLKEHNTFWNSKRRERAKELGLTPAETATIASIAEEESAKPDERGKIGRLYINRLQRGMQLQADPTVKFAIGDFGIKRITSQHLSVESPYNTYRVKGLPPGPIRIPERATIDAVLESQPHDFIYMCAKSDFSGYHDFAKDYNRHRINAARYHRALEARSIK